MAVDQASAHPDLLKYLLTMNNINTSTHPANLYSHSSVTNPLAVGGLPPNESLLLPFYGLNDDVFPSGKFQQPPVKDDSGVTFNNSFVTFVPPTSTRKRPREQTVLQPATAVSGGGLLTSNPIASTCTSMGNKESTGFTFLGENISLQIMQQQLELDTLISQHIEKMKMEIEGRKKQQLTRMMAAIEDAMIKKMSEKEEEISRIQKVNSELEERVKTLCLENQLWRDLAQSNEATANALRSNLEQVLQQMRENVAGELTDDAVSCCGSSGYGEEEEQRSSQRRRHDEPQQEEAKAGDGEKWVYRGEKNNKRLCNKCGQGESSVLLLPCRHLCLCTACGPAVNACPICNSVKSGSVHVNLS